MARTPQEIFAHHAQALADGDLDEVIADYSDDAVMITAAGVARGKDGVRAAFTQLFAATSNANFEKKNEIYAGDVMLLEWVLESPEARLDGNDTFVFADGLIRAQTISYSAHPKGSQG